jgi:ferredoxin-thioredoxin reductase catalytic subunit
MKVQLVADEKHVKAIREGLKKNDGYCPCRIQKTEDNKCMCKEFREETPVGEQCHCGLYIKTEA